MKNANARKRKKGVAEREREREDEKGRKRSGAPGGYEKNCRNSLNFELLAGYTRALLDYGHS